jgi:hypothetical protein
MEVDAESDSVRVAGRGYPVDAAVGREQQSSFAAGRRPRAAATER